MALFQRKQHFLGIDIGTSSIKAVELSNTGGHPKLETFGYVERSFDIIKSDNPQNQSALAGLLKQMLKQTRVTTQKVVAALPSFAVFTSIISLPTMSEKDLLAAIRWEAKKFVPMPLEDMILDWRIVKNQDQTQGKDASKSADVKKGKARNVKILLTAAPKSLVRRYLTAFKAADLQLVSLETEAFALERSLIGNDPSPVLLIDIGASATDMSVIANGIPVLNRSIDVGGDALTRAIMNSLSIDHARAEQFKRDFGMTHSTANDQIPKTLEFVVGSIINEVKYCLNLYQSQEPKPVEKIVLAGGSAFLASLPEYLTRILNTKVIIGDPWARIVCPAELQPMLQEIAPSFAVAIGLAMREIV